MTDAFALGTSSRKEKIAPLNHHHHQTRTSSGLRFTSQPIQYRDRQTRFARRPCTGCAAM